MSLFDTLTHHPITVDEQGLTPHTEVEGHRLHEIERVLIPYERLRTRIAGIAEQITQAHRHHHLHLIAVGEESQTYTQAIATHLDRLRKTYHTTHLLSQESTGYLPALRGKHTLLLPYQLRTGSDLADAIHRLRRIGASSITCYPLLATSIENPDEHTHKRLLGLNEATYPHIGQERLERIIDARLDARADNDQDDAPHRSRRQRNKPAFGEAGFSTPELPIAGYGRAINGNHADAPYIGVVRD